MLFGIKETDKIGSFDKYGNAWRKSLLWDDSPGSNRPDKLKNFVSLWLGVTQPTHKIPLFKPQTRVQQPKAKADTISNPNPNIFQGLMNDKRK